MSMVTKAVKLVTYHDNLPPKNSHDSSMNWSCEVTLQIKYIKFLLAEDPWTPNYIIPGYNILELYSVFVQV